MTIRTEMMKEVKEWLVDENYNITIDEIIEMGWIEDDEPTEFTDDEIAAIEDMFDDEEIGRAEARAKEEQLIKEWEIERRYQEMEYRAMVA